MCYGFQFPGFLHLSITSALSRVLAQCILPSSMLHLRSDCLSPVLYQRSLPSLYLLHSPCRLCEVLPLYVCMSERFSFYSVYLLSLTHAELTLSICLQPALRPPARSGFWFSATYLDRKPVPGYWMLAASPRPPAWFYAHLYRSSSSWVTFYLTFLLNKYFVAYGSASAHWFITVCTSFSSSSSYLFI